MLRQTLLWVTKKTERGSCCTMRIKLPPGSLPDRSTDPRVYPEAPKCEAGSLGKHKLVTCHPPQLPGPCYIKTLFCAWETQLLQAFLIIILFLMSTFLNSMLQQELFRPSVPLLRMLDVNKVVCLRKEREHDFVSKVCGMFD